jgi:hypothetical protein
VRNASRACCRTRSRRIRGACRSATRPSARDDRHLLSANDDGKAWLRDWRPQTGAIVATSVRLSQSVALSPDRRWLSVGGPNRTTLLVRCRGCAPLDELERDARRSRRALTATERRDYLHEGQATLDPY